MAKSSISPIAESKNDGGIKSHVKEFIWPFVVFALVLVIFGISLNFNFKWGLLLIFVFLLIAFLKNTKFLFYLFILSLPFTRDIWRFKIGFDFYLSYLFFTLLFISFFYNKFRNGDYSFALTHLDLPMFLFLLVATVSVFQTVYVGSAPSIHRDAFRSYPWISGLLRIMFLMFMFAIYYMTVNIVRDKKIFKKTLLLLIITAFIASLHGIFGFLFTLITSSRLPALIDPLIDANLRIRSVFEEPLFLGSYLLTLLPVLYCLVVSKTKYLNRHFLIISSLILTLALFLTVSRGSWFAYAVFLTLLIIIYWKKVFRDIYKKLLKVFFAVLLIFTIVLVVNSMILEENINEKTIVVFKSVSAYTIKPIISAFDPSSTAFSSTQLRFYAMKYAWKGFIQHPILGVGYANYPFYAGMRSYSAVGIGVLDITEVSNYPLKILAETGLIGFIVLIWLFIEIVRSACSTAYHERDKTRKALVVGYFLSFIAVSASFMFFSHITLPYLWVMLGMLMSLCGTKITNLKII